VDAGRHSDALSLLAVAPGCERCIIDLIGDGRQVRWSP